MDICDRIENWVFNNEPLVIGIALNEHTCPEWTVKNFDLYKTEGIGSDLESAFNEFLAKLEDEKKIKG